MSPVRRARRDDLTGLPVDVAPSLLGAHLRTVLPVRVKGEPEASATRVESVVVRITEVEAYHGKGTGPIPDPGSHARMGRTARNATMWGAPGHLYVYRSHGIHTCVNVVCAPEGVAGGVLIRGGEVIEGVEAAEVRTGRQGRDLARGPGRLGQALGVIHPRHDGADLVTGSEIQLWMPEGFAPVVLSGPRVGVAGIAGTAEFPWRFFLPDEPTVSPFRPGRGAA